MLTRYTSDIYVFDSLYLISIDYSVNIRGMQVLWCGNTFVRLLYIQI